MGLTIYLRAFFMDLLVIKLYFMVIKKLINFNFLSMSKLIIDRSFTLQRPIMNNSLKYIKVCRQAFTELKS